MKLNPAQTTVLYVALNKTILLDVFLSTQLFYKIEPRPDHCILEQDALLDLFLLVNSTV